MKPLIKFMILVLFLLITFLVYQFTPLKDFLEPQQISRIIEKIRQTWWAPIAFVLFYGFGGVASPLTLAIGAIYGLWYGFLLNLLAANFSANAYFLFARLMGRQFVNRFLKGRLHMINSKAARHGFRIILYMRIVPFFPFQVVNLTAGVSKIRMRDFALASAFGMIPMTFVFNYFAASLLSGAVEAKRHAVVNLIISTLLIVVVSLIPIFIRYLRKKKKFTKDLEVVNEAEL